MCSTPRSGSNLLCSYIRSLNVIGPITEWLNPDVMATQIGEELDFDEAYYQAHPKEVLSRIIDHRMGGDGSFSAKIHYLQLFEMINTGFNPFDLFTNPGFVHIVRKDLIGQAISYSKAEQEKAWTSLETPVTKAEYNFLDILEKLQMIVSSNLEWIQFIQAMNKPCLVVVYEDLEQNPQKIVGDVMRQWGYSVTPEQLSRIKTKYSKQTNELNVQWRQRFEEDAKKRNIRIV